MKKTAWIALLTFAVAVPACKAPGDVLATYDNGKITRAEFYDWMEMKRISREAAVKSIKQQKSRLEAMALDRLAAEEARKEKLDQSADFAALRDMATDSQLMELLYEKEIRDKKKFSVPAVKAQHIMLRIRDYKIKNNRQEKLTAEELSAETNQVLSKARGIISKLKKGEKFENLASRYSEDNSRRKGGDAGFIVHGMMPGEYTEAAFALGRGEYTPQPVLVRNSVYVIKVTKKKTLTDRNVEKEMGDKMQAARIKNRFYNEAAREYLEKLAAEKDVVSHLEEPVVPGKNHVIFKIADRDYTVEDLNKRTVVYHNRQKGRPRVAMTPEQKKLMAQNFFRVELLKREAARRGLDRDQTFLKRAALRTDGLLAREYYKKKTDQPLAVTAREITEEYEQNKEQRYYRMQAKGKEKVKVIEPLGTVEGRIRKMLEGKKRAAVMKDARDDLLKRYNFKINQKKLEGK
ncbi:MAG TPA: hypothetical protein ENN21_03330 [Spirochaetes bacterium]|nr:hypothetical protein [Spirochaetota bacterium]